MDLSRPSASILFMAPECAPLTKTGGLGDVCAALPAALRSLGFDVRTLVPGYPGVLRAAGSELCSIRVLGADVRIREGILPSGVPLLVLDCPELYVRPGGPYLSEEGVDWPDNPLRFGVFSRTAALLAGKDSPLEWRPAVVHCNDWPCGLAPAYLRFDGATASSLMTVHNLAFQGLFDSGWVQRLSLPAESYDPEGLEFHGRMSFLKAGLAYARQLNTVSPGYAREIQMPELGCGLDGLLRHRSAALQGILNGIDTRVWNPATDAHLPRTYDAASLELKAENRAALQRRMNLALEPRTPVFGLVGRLTAQKGIDLVLQVAERLAERGQLAILGEGERELEAALAGVAARHPGRVGLHVGFDERLAHLIEAGADLFLMPSRYEPCGLNQMYSQRYGTPPVVHATGGLADTVEDGKTGFVFPSFTPESFLEALERALRCYGDAAAWRAMQRAGMARDFSWSAAARRYAGLYRSLAALAPG
jgi:starch synthase